MSKIADKTKALNKEHHRQADAKANGLTLDLTKGSFNTSTKSSSINPNSKLIINLEIAKKYAHKLSGQMGIICTIAEQNNGSVNFVEANELWITQFVDTGIYSQDLITVVSHYRGRFNSPKGYKQIPSADLKKLITVS
tara:strand:- start:169 stop:582 length:414 start_codon:yes stop_codon:yes gene_type:complete